MEFKPGDEFIVKVGDKEYTTFIDKSGIQRFKVNNLLDYCVDSGMIDINKLCIAYQENKFTLLEYAEFYMQIGYSVSGFSCLEQFNELDIENPLWLL